MGNTVVIIDGGGRGSALVDAYAKSSQVENIIAIPGNDLMSSLTTKPVKIFPHLKTTSKEEILQICLENKVSLVDVAQDNAVQSGLVDELQAHTIPTIGPTKNAGEIEWSKKFSRELGEKIGLPQPYYKSFTSSNDAIAFLKTTPHKPWFIKADGLAEGKGVIPTQSSDEAIRLVEEMKRFGASGQTFLLEEWLKGDDGTEGEEFSSFYLCDGKNFLHLGDAQDHKRVGNFDQGENTGGMGCCTPPKVITEDIQKEIQEKIIKKVIEELNRQGRPYYGVLYLGGMLVMRKGKLTPYVIEFNARWGDPEAETIIPGIISDMYELSMAVANKDLSTIKIQTDGKTRVVVAATSRGYPGDYSSVKGKEIFGITKAMQIPGIKVYGAGVKILNNRHYANGGRLFYIVGEGTTIFEARENAYQAMSCIYIEGNNLQYRTDIGWRDCERFIKNS